MLKTIITKRKVPGTPGWYWWKGPLSNWVPVKVEEGLHGLSLLPVAGEPILVEDAPGVWGPEIKPPKEKQIVA